MSGDHYFSASPDSSERRKRITVTLSGRPVTLSTASGVFSGDRLDPGTSVLLRHIPDPPAHGDVLDLGCGWGPIALSAALAARETRVWAVDVNDRALALTRSNASDLGLTNIVASTPDDVPPDVRFASIRSNPPIRIGKQELHDMLLRWIPRLEPGGDGHFVVQKNLGSDSLQRWLTAALGDEYSVDRSVSSKGYRVLRVDRAA